MASDRVIGVAATGGLGSGFLEESLIAAMEAGADFIGCDAGSSDGGPYFLGSGEPKVSAEAYERDLRPMLRAAVRYGVPLLMGTSGYAGGRPHVAWAAERVRKVASEEGLAFDMAVIDSEVEKDYVHRKLREGRITPLGHVPPLDPERIDRAARITAQMGSEPFEEALRNGAQVIVAGRASDTAIYAAVPRMHGLVGGPTWHAAKVLECGAASVEHRHHPDCLVAEITEDAFTVYPPNERMRCTPQSVAAQTLYENADPFHLIEPAGVLDTTGAVYEQAGPRSVRVSGSTMLERGFYDVRLEASERLGYRSVAVGGIRDPLVLRDLDGFLTDAVETSRRKIQQSMGLGEAEGVVLSYRVYGRDGCLGPLEPTPIVTGHEVGIVLDVVAPTREQARGACAIAWHTVLHHFVEGWSGLVSNVAYPFSPPHMDAGEVYEFTMNHVLALDDPLEPFAFAYERVG